MSIHTPDIPMDDWDDEFLDMTCRVLRTLRNGPAGYRAEFWRPVMEHLQARGLVEFYDDGAILHARRPK